MAAAAGGWLAAAHRLHRQHRLEPWLPESDLGAAALKRSLARHRRDIIKPAIMSRSDSPQADPPLPWAWLAINAGSAFTQAAFELWWQLRILGQPFPATHCPWCDPVSPLTKEHLQDDCGTFAYHCWLHGVLPTEAFMYPPQRDWFAAALGATHALESARHGD